MQQQNSSSSSKSGLNKLLAQQESCKCAIARKDKYMETAQQVNRIASSIVDQSSSSATSLSDSGDDFQLSSTPATSCQFLPEKSKRSIFTTEVATSLDQVKIPDHGAMFVVGTLAQAPERRGFISKHNSQISFAIPKSGNYRTVSIHARQSTASRLG